MHEFFLEHEIGEKRSKINMENLRFEPLPQYLAFKHRKNGIFKVIFHIEYSGAPKVWSKKNGTLSKIGH